MKKTIYLFVGAVTMLLAFSSCKQSAADDTLPFSTLTVEQQKQTIEQNGLDLVNKVAMQNTPAMVALNAFNTNIGGSAFFVKPLAQLRANLLRNDMNAVETYSKQMKVAAVVAVGKWGTYTWNQSIKDFDFAKGPNYTATILFPATENSLTNNGEINIVYSASSILIPGIDSVEYMPKSLSVVMKVSGNTALTFNFNGAYKSDATPTNVTQTLVIDKYNWSIAFTNNDVDVSTKYAFTYDQSVLLKLEIGAAGSLTATNIQDNIDQKPENVISSGAVLFQVMNIAMKGSINDFKAFAAEAKTSKPDSVIHTETYGKWTEYLYNKAYYDKNSSIINKYLKIYGYFANENKKFADVEFYTYESSYVYNDWVWNPTKQNYDIVPVTRTNYEMQPRFVLSDGSKVAIEDYVKTGFQGLIDKINSYGTPK